MTNSMPAYPVFHHRSFMGYVSAVSHAQAKVRAKKAFPNKRLIVEMPLNVKPTVKDRLNCNISYNCSRA